MGSGASDELTAFSVQATGRGTREEPFDLRRAGATQGMQALLSSGAIKGRETSVIVASHRGEPVTAIIQRTKKAGPTQGEVFVGPGEAGTRGTLGAFPRRDEIPGLIGPQRPPLAGTTAVTALTTPFGGSGSLAAGHIQEAAVEGRISPNLTPDQARVVAAAVLLEGPVEATRNPLALVTNPSLRERSIRATQPGAQPAPLEQTLGGAQAPSGSAKDFRTLEGSLSRIDPNTGQQLPPVPGAPVPRGVRRATSPGSAERAAGLAQNSIDALADTILKGFVVDGKVLVLNAGDLN